MHFMLSRNRGARSLSGNRSNVRSAPFIIRSVMMNLRSALVVLTPATIVPHNQRRLLVSRRRIKNAIV